MTRDDTLSESGKSDSEAKERIKIMPKVTKSSDYKIVYAQGAFGGLDPVEGRVIFYVDRLIPKVTNDQSLQLDAVERELQVEVHMSPLTFKSVADWMHRHAEKLIVAPKKED